MANRISPTTLTSTRFVASSSRYVSSSVIYYGDKNTITFTTYRKQTSTNVSSSDQFTVIESGFEFRPDLVSQRTYGLPDFWWAIMEANDIKDIFDFRAGKTIRLPGNIF